MFSTCPQNSHSWLHVIIKHLPRLISAARIEFVVVEVASVVNDELCAVPGRHMIRNHGDLKRRGHPLIEAGPVKRLGHIAGGAAIATDDEHLLMDAIPGRGVLSARYGSAVCRNRRPG